MNIKRKQQMMPSPVVDPRRGWKIQTDSRPAQYKAFRLRPHDLIRDIFVMEQKAIPIKPRNVDRHRRSSMKDSLDCFDFLESLELKRIALKIRFGLGLKTDR